MLIFIYLDNFQRIGSTSEGAKYLEKRDNLISCQEKIMTNVSIAKSQITPNQQLSPDTVQVKLTRIKMLQWPFSKWT